MKTLFIITCLLLINPTNIKKDLVPSELQRTVLTIHEVDTTMYQEEVNLTEPLIHEKNKIERLNTRAAIIQKESEYLSIIFKDPKKVKKVIKEINREKRIAERDSINENKS